MRERKPGEQITMSMSEFLPKILCVDDEPNVLEGLERTLFEDFDVTTAASGAEGLKMIEEYGPFCVVVSDMRMPEMDGAQFLAKTRELAPDSTRVLLTGQADLNSAISAVNDGNIYRFLCKPCPKAVLVKALDDAHQQYRLVTSEKELLQGTLRGAINTLIEVLELAAPEAFSRASAVKRYISHMAEKVGGTSKWQYELAGLLSHIGSISLPPNTLEMMYSGGTLSDKERQMVDSIPELGYKLLKKIPRLENLAMIVRLQNQHDPEDCNEQVLLGVRLLRIAIDVDKLVEKKCPIANALKKLAKKGGHDDILLGTLNDYRDVKHFVVRKMPLDRLEPGMVLDKDIMFRNGGKILGGGTELSAIMIERLFNFQNTAGVIQPIMVRVR